MLLFEICFNRSNISEFFYLYSKPSTSLNEVGNNQEITMASRQETTDKHSGKQSNKTNKPDNSPRYTDEDVLSGTNESSLDSKLFSTSKVESNNIPLIGDSKSDILFTCVARKWNF